MAVIETFATSRLILTQDVNINIKIEKVSHFLPLDDDLKSNIKIEEVRSRLYFSHSATPSVTINESVSHTLSLVQKSLPRVFVRTVQSQLLLTQSVSTNPGVRSQLHLSQDVDYTLAKGLHSTLALTHQVTFTITRNIEVEQTLTLTSKCTGYLPSKFWTSFPITVVQE